MTESIDLTQVDFLYFETLDLIHLVLNPKGNKDIIKQAWQVLKIQTIGQTFWNIARDCIVPEIAIEAYHLLQKIDRPINLECYEVKTEECAIAIFEYKTFEIKKDTLHYLINTVFKSPFVNLSVKALHKYIDFDTDFDRKNDQLFQICISGELTKSDPRIINLAFNTLANSTQTKFEFTNNQLGVIITQSKDVDVQVQACKTLLAKELPNLNPYFFVLKNCKVHKVQKLIWAKIKKSNKKVLHDNYLNFSEILSSNEYWCSDEIFVEAWEFFKSSLKKKNRELINAFSEGYIVNILKHSPSVICEEVWELTKTLFAADEVYLADIFCNCDSEAIKNEAKLMYISIDGTTSSAICNLLSKNKNNDFRLIKEGIKILQQKGRKPEDLNSLLLNFIAFGDLNAKETKYLWKKYLKTVDINSQKFITIVRNCKHYNVVLDAWSVINNEDWKTNSETVIETLKFTKCEKFAHFIVEEILDFEKLGRSQVQSIAENQFESIQVIGWNMLKMHNSFCFSYLKSLTTQAADYKLRDLALNELSNDYYTQLQTIYSLG